MRRFLAVLAGTGLAALSPTPASALGDVRYAVIMPSEANQARVTCDTSSYPAASYPCSFAMDSACGDGSCAVSVRGTLNAVPALSPFGQCSFDDADDSAFTVTFTSGDDPAWQTTNGIDVIVQQAEVQYGQYGPNLPTTLLLAFYEVSAGDSVAGQIASSFRFSDLMWDCRTRAGGDPSNAEFDPNLVGVQTTGAIVVTR